MKLYFKSVVLFLAAGFCFSSCSIFHSDVNSNNPLIAEQAQRVQDLKGQLNTQKSVVDSEKAKQKALEYQIKSAKQELKARKNQVKVGY